MKTKLQSDGTSCPAALLRLGVPAQRLTTTALLPPISLHCPPWRPFGVGATGAFVVPHGCRGVSALTPYSTIKRWGFMFCWLLVGQMSPYLYLKTID